MKNKAYEQPLKFGQSLAQTLLKGGAKLGDWLTNGDSTSLETSQIIRAQGAVLRELHALLKEQDPRNRFGGLVRVQNKKREFLWVYEDFVDEY